MENQAQEQPKGIGKEAILWSKLGHPEYVEKYAFPELPKGAKVTGVEEVGGQVSVSYTLDEQVPLGKAGIQWGKQPIGKRAVLYGHTPVGKRAILERRTQTELPLGKRAILSRFTLSPEEKEWRAASVAFYTKIGFPQFGGEYAPFDYPAGAGFESITETPVGLQIKLKIPFTTSASITKEILVSPRISRWSELKDFGQDIANVKANAGTSSLTAIIEQYATGLYSKDIVTKTMQKTGFLPSQASNLMKVAGAVSTVESYVNPNVPSLFELGSKSPEFIIGRLTGEAMMLAGTSELFTWMTRGTVNPLRGPVEKWLMKSYESQAKGAVESGKAASWSLKQKLVMKITGITPNLARGEVSIPVMEAVSKTGVISGVPSGLPFTDIGWELTEAPRMGGVMITKVPSVTTPKALEIGRAHV